MRALVIALAALLLAAAPAPAFAPAGEGIAFSSRGHVALLTAPGGERTRLHVAGPDRRFSAPDSVPGGEFVAVGPRGDVLVAGHTRTELPPDEDGVRVEFALWAAYRPPGGPIGPPVQLGASQAWGENFPALAVDGTGTAAVLWAADADPQPLRASVRPPSGEWLAPQDLGGASAFRPVLAASDDGLMTAAWEQKRAARGNKSQVAVATRLPGTAFGPPAVVAGVERDPGSPSVASNARGDAVIAWVEQFPRPPRHAGDVAGGFAVHGAFRSRLGRFGRPRRLSTIEAASPVAAVAASGRMILAWAGDRHVEARVRSAGGTLRPAQRVTRDLDENASPAVLGHGRGLVAWVDRDPGLSIARVAAPDASGRFGRARTVVRARQLPDPPLLLPSPGGLRWVTAFGRPGDPLLRTRSVPRG